MNNDILRRLGSQRPGAWLPQELQDRGLHEPVWGNSKEVKAVSETQKSFLSWASFILGVLLILGTILNYIHRRSFVFFEWLEFALKDVRFYLGIILIAVAVFGILRKREE